MKWIKSKYSYFLTFFSLAFLCLAQTTPAAAQDTIKKEDTLRPWTVTLQTRYFFRSHTSYEFGNPYPPYQAPLSRLEFPLNTWWAGASLRREFSRFSVGAEAFRNVTSRSDGVMTDSDWDDDAHPDVKTIYSESSCRMEPSYMVYGDVDLKISDWLRLPKWLDLRPAAGIAWQRFSVVAYNGLQTYPAPGSTQPPDPLPGDLINLEQTYWRLFTGFKVAFDLGRPFSLSSLKLLTQLDWGYVYGTNEDYHLLRSGRRITNDTTTGDAWHAQVNLKAGITRNFSANIGLEYLRITTTGTHRLVNEPLGVDFSFDHGVKVWSEQMNVTMSLEYSF